MTLMAEMNERAFKLGIPLTVHIDVTYRCNERCVHCYLDHDDKGEMTTQEIKNVLEQLAEAGVFFLVFSGGEVFMRRDFLDLVEHARKLMFNVKVKTNGVMIHQAEARRLRELGVEQVQLSVYSHRPEVHDAITKLPGSFKRTLDAIRFLKSQGLKVTLSNVLMTVNRADQQGTHALAKELGVSYTLDPTVTPKLEGYSCSAGHTACYISPYGDVFPCVQFPLPTGNVRRQKFADIWYRSPQMEEVRNIKVKDLPVCSTCTHAASCSRCPGLAYMEGSMRGPSSTDCEKSFHRTGIPSANMLRKNMAAGGPLVQILPITV